MTDSSTSQATSESLVLSAHTVSVLARHVADRLRNGPAAQAFTTALDDVAALAEAWVTVQIDALGTAPQPTVVAPVVPQVAPLAQPAASPAPQPATSPQPLTATAAVLAATTQLPQGATARAVAAHVAAMHAMEVTPETVRAIRSKHRRGQAQPGAQPEPQQGTGMYL